MSPGDTAYLWRHREIQTAHVLEAREQTVYVKLPSGQGKRIRARHVFPTFEAAKEYALDIATGHLAAARRELERQLREHRRIEALQERRQEVAA